MSTSPDTRTEDRLITLISRWLAGHIGNAELQRGIDEAGDEGLGPGQSEALGELSERLIGGRHLPEQQHLGADRLGVQVTPDQLDAEAVVGPYPLAG